MKFYRYEAVEYARMDMDDYPIARNSILNSIPNPTLVLMEYSLSKETPKGYWITYGTAELGYLRGKSIWVSKEGKKRYAYPTKEEALNNFILRNKRRCEILERQLASSKACIFLAETQMNKFVHENI